MTTKTSYRVGALVVRNTSEWKDLIEKVLEFAREQGYSTFNAEAFWKSQSESFDFREVLKVLDQLHAQKRLIRLNDRRFLSVEAMQEIEEKIRELIMRNGSMAISDCQEIFGYGRKRGIPILDYLDSIGLTCRVGNVRVLAPLDRGPDIKSANPACGQQIRRTARMTTVSDGSLIVLG